MNVKKIKPVLENLSREDSLQKMVTLLDRCIDKDKNLSICNEFKYIDCEIDGNQIIMYVDVKDSFGRYERKIYELNMREVSE